MFLYVYGGFFAYHLFSIEWGNEILVVGLLFMGATLAIAAHRGHRGWLTIAFILGHMTLEWFNHAQHGWHYGTREVLLHSTHSGMDILFLWFEVNAHFQKFRWPLMAGATALLAGIFLLALETGPEVASFLPDGHIPHTHALGPFEALVIGGIMGCLGWHFFSKKHTHDKEMLSV